MLKVAVPHDKAELQKQIKALEYVMKNDISEKEKEIHSRVLKGLKEALVYRRYLDM